jgi:hypothetical protein
VSIESGPVTRVYSPAVTQDVGWPLAGSLAGPLELAKLSLEPPRCRVAQINQSISVTSRYTLQTTDAAERAASADDSPPLSSNRSASTRASPATEETYRGRHPRSSTPPAAPRPGIGRSGRRYHSPLLPRRSLAQISQVTTTSAEETKAKREDAAPREPGADRLGPKRERREKRRRRGAVDIDANGNVRFRGSAAFRDPRRWHSTRSAAEPGPTIQCAWASEKPILFCAVDADPPIVPPRRRSAPQQPLFSSAGAWSSIFIGLGR